VILAKKLKFVLSFSYDILEMAMNLERQRLLGFYIAVPLALTFRALELTLSSDPSRPILRVGYHFSGDTVPASSVPAAHHDYRLPFRHVEPVAAIKAI
jgi:hypothetical protein